MTCAFAVRGALKKIPGVESVDVSLNKGLATVKLNPGNTVRPEEFWNAIRKNGFTPKQTRVVVRGTLTAAPQAAVTVSGTSQVFPVKMDDKRLPEASQNSGKLVIVEGILTPDKSLKSSPLEAQSIKAAQ